MVAENPQTLHDLEPRMRLKGIVKKTDMYGAIVDLGLRRDGLIHISQLSSDHVNQVTDVVKVGDEVEVWVTRVDPDRGRISLSMVEPPEVTWGELKEGETYTGTVTRIESYGAFVEIGAERPGLLHVREMSNGYVRHPSDLMAVGDEIDVQIVNLDRRRRRIDLGTPDYEAVLEEQQEDQPPMKTAMEIALEQAQAEVEESGSDKPRRRQKDETSRAEQASILASTLQQHSE